MPNVTRLAAVAASAAAIVVPTARTAAPDATRRCATLPSAPWTRAVDGRVAHGTRYRVDSERLSCFVVTRLASQLIPLRTEGRLEAARPPGYVCMALGSAANPYRPATAVGICLQKPLDALPARSFSWRPVS